MLVPIMCTGNYQFILQGLKSLQDHYRDELLHREIPVVITGNGFAVLVSLSFTNGRIKGNCLLTTKNY